MNEGAARLDGRVAVVTGAAGGIGRATCAALFREGALVVAVDRSNEAVDEVCAELRGEGLDRITGIVSDVTREADMQAMAQAVEERSGRIDLLVTCAGILRGPGSLPKPMHQVSVAEWDMVIDVNLKGVFLSNRAVLPAMIKQRRGTIINLSSTSGLHGKAHDAPYCATKFGVIGFSESIAEEVRGYGIKVLTVLPDAVDTPLWDQNGPIKPDYALAPERVADLIVFMAALPHDTILSAPVIGPFRSRRRRKGKRAAEQSEAASQAASVS